MNSSQDFMAAITKADDQFLAHLGDVPHLPSTAKDIARHPVTLGGLGVRHFGRAAKTAFVLSLTRSLRYATPTLDHPPDTLHLTPERARPFISWDNPATTQPQFQTYQALAPLVLAAHNTTHPGNHLPTVHHLVTSCNLKGLATAIYKANSATHMEAHLQTAPPHVTAALPSLLSHHTSVPLCSYNRRFPHNRLDPDVFTLLFQRKLRLPLLPATLSHTPCRFCHKPFDPYGDHLFQCFYNKKVLSDNIRDTLYTVCSHLAPMAGFVHSKHAVSCEPAGLLPDHPAKRPADVGLLIRPAALSNPPSTPVSTVAIDITVTSSPTTDPPARPTPQKPLTKAHLDSLRRKLSHSASVHNPAYFQNLLDNNILLLPFTIDPFGGLGYHAHRFQKRILPTAINHVH